LRRVAHPGLTGDRLFVTDGGLETVLIFHHGLDLPEFAAFDLLKSDAGSDTIRAYYEPYLEIARKYAAGFILEAPTWRASPNWGARLGYSSEQLDAVNRRAIGLMEELRAANEDRVEPIVISGCIGPEADAYAPNTLVSANEAQRYHSEQIASFSRTAVDMVTALTITYADEAVGIVRASVDAEVPAVISFTVETDGRLPSGQPLREAIEQVDAETSGAPAYFMVNCAHPTHFAHALEEDGPWLHRLGGIRANASRLSHEELDQAETLDDGDPADFGARYRELQGRLPSLRVVGGCCGTDHRHVAEVCAALAGVTRSG
jgi:homocysteine S-methyltransferase